MDAALPFLTNTIFDAALEGGANYSNMGVWTVPEDEPKCYGVGKQCFKEFMADYNFAKNNKIDNISLSMVLTSNNKNHVTDFKNFVINLK